MALPGRVPGKVFHEWRMKHGYTGRQVNRLFGFESNSDGRAVYRWQKEGAPPYVGVIMAYIDKFGPELGFELAEKREAVE